MKCMLVEVYPKKVTQVRAPTVGRFITVIWMICICTEDSLPIYKVNKQSSRIADRRGNFKL